MKSKSIKIISTFFIIVALSGCSTIEVPIKVLDPGKVLDSGKLLGTCNLSGGTYYHSEEYIKYKDEFDVEYWGCYNTSNDWEGGGDGYGRHDATHYFTLELGYCTDIREILNKFCAGSFNVYWTAIKTLSLPDGKTFNFSFDSVTFRGSANRSDPNWVKFYWQH